MEPLDFEFIDSDFPLFDVVISMPPGSNLETIQKLAETVAGLSPDRVDRLITVLRSTPNAKVGSGLLLELAEEEKARFIKAGLHVELKPMMPVDTPIGKVESVETLIGPQIRAELEKKDVASKAGFLTSGAGLLVATTVAISVGMLYMVGKGSSPGGTSQASAEKQSPRNDTGGAASQQATAGGSAADNSSTTAGQAGDVDADDRLIQAARAGSGAGAPTAGAAEVIPKQTKQLLSAELAILLAEIGQVGRAREVLKALADGINPAADAASASALQTAQIKVQAWSVQRMESVQARQAAEDLKLKTQGIASAQERTQLQGQVAVILSRNAQLPPEIARMFLSLGAESLKAVSGGPVDVLTGDLAVSTAQVLLNETTARAKAGVFSKAKASAAQVEELIKQAPDAWTQSRLFAIDHLAKIQTGQADKAAKSLESALLLAAKNNNLAERARWLRAIAQLSDAGTQDQFETAAASLQSQLNAKPGLEKARGLTELALLYMTAGLPGKSGQLRNSAQATTGLSPTDSSVINTDLAVRGDMAMAKSLHGLGRYAESEVVLQRLGGYLF